MEYEMEKPTVVVIGAGIGGIATAARLAQHGCKVTVVENVSERVDDAAVF